MAPTIVGVYPAPTRMDSCGAHPLRQRLRTAAASIPPNTCESSSDVESYSFRKYPRKKSVDISNFAHSFFCEPASSRAPFARSGRHTDGASGGQARQAAASFSGSAPKRTYGRPASAACTTVRCAAKSGPSSGTRVLMTYRDAGKNPKPGGHHYFTTYRVVTIHRASCSASGLVGSCLARTISPRDLARALRSYPHLAPIGLHPSSRTPSDAVSLSQHMYGSRTV